MDNAAASPVFKALTRHPTLLGVDYNYCLLSGLAVILAFIFSDSFYALLLFFPLHLMGYISSKIDPDFFKLLSVRATLGRIKNYKLWGCQSYGAF